MNVLLIGCGRMGGAMVRGWLAQPAVQSIAVIDPMAKPDLTNPDNDPRITFYPTPQDWTAQSNNPDIIVLAVKPQMMGDVNATLPAFIGPDVVVLSIAAGITLANLTSAWGENRPIVRSMPNTPGAIGQGSTVCIINKNVQQKHADMVVSLLSVLGSIHQVTEEIHIDAATALSGSGPAYVYNFTEALENAGKKIGLPDDLARMLARETVIGAAALMAHDANTPPAALREAVTSPGGTTEAALKVLMGNQVLEDLMTMALKAAFSRSQQLAKS